MSPSEVVICGLAIAFVCVENRPHIKLFDRKPFKCMKCMTGWVTLAVAWLADYGWDSLLFFPIGVMVGSIFSAIKMRWL